MSMRAGYLQSLPQWLLLLFNALSSGPSLSDNLKARNIYFMLLCTGTFPTVPLNNQKPRALCLLQELNWEPFVMTYSYLYPLYMTFILSNIVLAVPFNLSSESSFLLHNSSAPVQGRGVNCFRRSPPEVGPIEDDCTEAIDMMMAEPDLTKIKTWKAPKSHASTKGWIYGTCEIDIGTPMADAEDLFSVWSCVEKAQNIMQKCLSAELVGGRTSIGRKGAFQVVISRFRQAPYSTE